MLPLKFVEKLFNYEGAGPEKGFKIFDLFQKCQTQNLHFLIFSKKSFRSEFHTPFYPILIPNAISSDQLANIKPETSLTLSCMGKFSIHNAWAGALYTPPPTAYFENGIKRFIYIHIAYFKH